MRRYTRPSRRPSRFLRTPRNRSGSRRTDGKEKRPSDSPGLSCIRLVIENDSLCRDRLRGNFHTFRVPPEAFEIVIGSGLLDEDVENEVAVVHQDPLSAIVPFNT